MEPEREMVDGYTFGDISPTFRLSSDQKEKQFFDTWIKTFLQSSRLFHRILL